MALFMVTWGRPCRPRAACQARRRNPCGVARDAEADRGRAPVRRTNEHRQGEGGPQEGSHSRVIHDRLRLWPARGRHVGRDHRRPARMQGIGQRDRARASRLSSSSPRSWRLASSPTISPSSGTTSGRSATPRVTSTSRCRYQRTSPCLRLRASERTRGRGEGARVLRRGEGGARGCTSRVRGGPGASSGCHQPDDSGTPASRCGGNGGCGGHPRQGADLGRCLRGMSGGSALPASPRHGTVSADRRLHIHDLSLRLSAGAGAASTAEARMIRATEEDAMGHEPGRSRDEGCGGGGPCDG